MIPLKGFPSPLGEISVFRAEAADEALVLSILGEAGEWLRSKGINQWPTDAGWPARIRERIGQGIIYLARLEGEAAGTFRIMWSDENIWGRMPDDGGYIHGLAIRRAWGGRGLGARLLCVAETMIAATGRRYARLDCWAENPVLNGYYRAAGYVFRGAVQPHGWYKGNRYEKDLRGMRA